MPRVSKYTKQQIQAMQTAVCGGMTNKEAGELLGVPEGTVSRYVSMYGWRKSERPANSTQTRFEKLGGRIGGLTKQKNRLERENEALRSQVADLMAQLAAIRQPVTTAENPAKRRAGLFGWLLGLMG